ncbi:MAG: outer membrane protein assembly factor BamE, partial [Alphaproteobacteria bacterium]|nr:outer membrane protein assembly factor BamE [Alphaproteobacteria bacterium]
GQETEKTGIFDPKVLKERIVAVTFDANGTITQVVDIPPGQEDVPFETATTPTHGNEITLMQQFLGNLGKFNNSKEANR